VFNASDLSHLIPGVRLMALRALGDASIADDVAQEALARAITALEKGSLRQQGNMAAFVAGIARHIITDYIRARRRIEVDIDMIELAHGKPDALATLIADEEKAQLRAALEDLSAVDREILRLSYDEGMSPAEVAERLGETSTVVRKRKSRALERLRSAFQRIVPERHESAARTTHKRTEVLSFGGGSAVVADV
jgi:RNA polymerase sigma-70 factor (ECF subfamily)